MEKGLVQSIRDTIHAALFPAFCLSCRHETGPDDAHPWLCTACNKKLITRWATCCSTCEKDIGFLTTPSCAHTRSDLDSLSFIFSYHTPTVQHLVRAYKYKLVRPIEDIWRVHIQKERLNIMRIPAEVLIPIPLHKRKERERGFNQAEAIARIISAITHTPLDTKTLLRVRGGQAQAHIKKPRTRMRNIRGVFHVADSKKVRGKRILLIDDVATTAATLKEAARTLKHAGARRVDGFVLAKN